MAVLTLYGVLALTMFGLWLKHRSVLIQREKMHARLGSMKGDLSATSKQLDLLSRGVETILSDSPEVHELLTVHQSLESAESLLFNQGIPISNSEAVAIATHAAKAILAHHPSTDDSGGSSTVPGLIPLSRRFAAVITEAEMMAEDIELTADQHRRMGELFLASERADWAEDCYKRANELDPEDEVALRSLAEIQRKSGDLDSLDGTLERILAISPDDIEVLREQTLLLKGEDESRVSRNRKRLEGLGEDSSVSQEESELSELTERAKSSSALSVHGAGSHLSPGESVERATKQLLIGEVQIAADTVESILEKDPNNGPGWMLKSRILASKGDRTKEALKCLRRANALGEHTVIQEAEILDNDGRVEASIEVLENHISTNPSDSEARAKLSHIWLRSGSMESSRSTLDGAPENSSDHEAIHIMRGRLHLSESEENRDNTGNHDQMMIVDALVSFDRAIDMNRESGLAWLGRARALRYQGTLDESEVALVRARRLIPNHASIPLEEAQLALEMGNLEHANALILEATTQRLENPTIPFIRGIIAANFGRLTEARDFFSNALSLDQEHVRARLNRCSAALLCDDLALALDDANYLVSSRPNHQLAKLRRAEVLMNHSDWSESENELRSLLKMNPSHTMALVHLGTCMIAMGKAEQAEAPLNKAIGTDPDLAEAWYQRALLYLDFGKIDEAKSDFIEAARADPQHIDAKLRIAAILHESSDPEKATMAWREVLDIDPQHRLARRRIAECQEQISVRAKQLLPKD